MEVDPAQAIPVQNVAQEYALVADARCACGGQFQVVKQALLRHRDCFYDLLTAICQRCDQERPFLFDISAFFGQPADK